MSDSLVIRLARPDDDAAIRVLLRETPLPGQISLAYAHEPSYFAAIEVTGRDRRVIVGELDGRIVGTGVMAFRQVYVNARPATVGYLGGLHLAPEARRFGGLARGFRFFGQMHRAERRVPFYISTIQEENREARELLTSRRAGLPAYHEIGRLRVLAYPLLAGRPRAASHIQILEGREAPLAELVACLEKIGPSRQLFPVVTAAQMTATTGVLRGLGHEDFLLARDGGRPVGTLAVWDQDSFRQSMVAGYRGPLRRARGLLGTMTHRILPEPGQAIPTAMVACLAVPHDRPDVLRALLSHARFLAARRGKAILFLGLAADDPLLRPAWRFPHLTFESRVYAVEWGDGLNVVTRLDARPLYLELGSL